MRKNNSNFRRVVVGVTIIAVVFLLAVVGQIMMISDNNNVSSTDTFADGVTISNINVGGLNKKQAEREVTKLLQDKIANMKLDVVYKDKVWSFTGQDFKVQDDTKRIIDDAFKYQQKRLGEIDEFKPNAIVTEGMSVDVAFAYLFEDMEAKISKIINQIEVEPVNSKVSFNPDKEVKFEYTKSINGLKVDKRKLFKDLEEEFKTNNSNMRVVINAISIEPKISESYLKDKTQLMSIFSTDLHNSKERRLHNVSYALSKFNGLTIKPNEEVSFNAYTSPQTLEGGYKKSIVILNGVFVEGVGGGLCQASTTMYNAAILAGLEILEVNKHTLPIGYIELGFDAMVSENWSDFRFKNNSPNNIYIKAYVKNERAYVEIYGKTLENGVKLKRRSEFVRTIPHPGDKLQLDEKGEFASKVLYKGERYRVKYPREGYEANAYLQYYSGGNLIKEELIRNEIYEPQQGLVIEGASDPPEEYTIPESTVEILKPQDNASDTTGSNVSSVLLDNNPTSFNP